MGRLTILSSSLPSFSNFFILIIFVCVIQSDYSYCEHHSQSSEDAARYRTGYACEGSQLNISCEEGSQIFVTRANYGRFSISICNDHGNLDWKVDCSSPTSRSVISERCNGREKCSVRASSDIFTDSCPGTRKYLEVQYQCKSSAGVNGSLIPILMKSSSVSSVQSSSSLSGQQPSVRPTIIIPITSLRKGTSSTTRGPPPVHSSPELSAGGPALNSFDIRVLGQLPVSSANGNNNSNNVNSKGPLSVLEESSNTNHHHHEPGIASSSINDTVGSINVSRNIGGGKSGSSSEESESTIRGPVGGSITVKNPLFPSRRNEKIPVSTSRPFTHFKPPSPSSTAHSPHSSGNSGPASTGGPSLNPADPHERNPLYESNNNYYSKHGSRVGGSSFESTTKVIEIRNPIHEIRFGEGISFFNPDDQKSTITRPPTVASSSGSSLSNSPTSTVSPSQDLITFNTVVIISLITLISFILFVSICFARNDRIRGNFKKSLSGLTWLPTCVTRSVHSGGKSHHLPPSALVHHSSSGSSPSTPAYFYSLDPAKLQPPPSPLIRPSIHHHHNHGSGNSSGNSSASSCLNGLGTSTVSTASRGYHQIQDVNPYAAPVPISMHEYEDIGTAMKDYHHRTLPSGHNNLTNPPSTTTGRQSTATNVRSHNNYNTNYHQRANHHQNNSNSAATLRHSHPPLEPIHHHSIHHPTHLFPESLYYEAAVSNNSSNNNLGVINPSQLIYGGRSGGSSQQQITSSQQQVTSSNSSTNYGFHNTRSPIYYSESRR